MKLAASNRREELECVHAETGHLSDALRGGNGTHRWLTCRPCNERVVIGRRRDPTDSWKYLSVTALYTQHGDGVRKRLRDQVQDAHRRSRSAPAAVRGGYPTVARPKSRPTRESRQETVQNAVVRLSEREPELNQMFKDLAEHLLQFPGMSAERIIEVLEIHSRPSAGQQPSSSSRPPRNPQLQAFGGRPPSTSVDRWRAHYASQDVRPGEEEFDVHTEASWDITENQYADVNTFPDADPVNAAAAGVELRTPPEPLHPGQRGDALVGTGKWAQWRLDQIADVNDPDSQRFAIWVVENDNGAPDFHYRRLADYLHYRIATSTWPPRGVPFDLEAYRATRVQDPEVMMVSGTWESLTAATLPSRDPIGAGVWDSAAGAVVHGRKWREDFTKTLRSLGLTYDTRPTTGGIRGVGGSEEVNTIYRFPVGLHGVNGEIESIEVEQDIPLLLSNQLQRELGVTLSYGTTDGNERMDKIQIRELGVKSTPLCRTTGGHPYSSLLWFAPGGHPGLLEKPKEADVMPTEPEELTVQEHTAEPDKEEENPEVPEEDCVEYELLCKRLVHDAKWLRGLKKSDAHLWPQVDRRITKCANTGEVIFDEVGVQDMDQQHFHRPVETTKNLLFEFYRKVPDESEESVDEFMPIQEDMLPPAEVFDADAWPREDPIGDDDEIKTCSSKKSRKLRHQEQHLNETDAVRWGTLRGKARMTFPNGVRSFLKQVMIGCCGLSLMATSMGYPVAKTATRRVEPSRQAGTS